MSTATATPAAPVKRGLPFPLSPSEGWATVILAVVVVLITIAAMQSLNWTIGLDILRSTALFGMLLGFIMSKQRLIPQWIAEIPTQALGIGFAIRLTAGVATHGDIGALMLQLGAWIQAAIGGRSSNDDAIFLLFLAVLTMLLGYVSMWLIFRSRSPWLAVIANAIVLIISIVYAPDDKSLYVILFMLAALLLLVRSNLVERMRIWQRKGLRYAPEIGWDFMQAGVLFTIVVMVVGSIMPGNYVSTALEDLWNGPSSPWSQVQSRFSDLFKVAIQGNGQNRVGFGNALAITGNVNLPTTPVFSYTYEVAPSDADLANSAYMFGLAYDQYDGKNWIKGKVNDRALAADPEKLGGPVDTAKYAKVTTTITVLTPPDGQYIYALGQPSTFSLPTTASSDMILANGALESFVSWSLKNSLTKNQKYTTVSYVSTATADELRAVPAPTKGGDANYPAALLQHYTKVPDDITSPNNKNQLLFTTLNEWMTINPDGTKVGNNMYDKLESIVAHFATKEFKYSTQNGTPKSDEDAALAVLDQKQGYCTWFATTMAVMARLQGYPARVAVGFAHGAADIPAGSDNKAPPTKPTNYTILGTDAHAWVQVYFPKYGWINFEPSVAQGSFLEFNRGTVNSTDTNDPTKQPKSGTTTPTPAAGTTPTPVATPGTAPNGMNSPVVQVAGKVAVSLTLILALVLLALLSIGTWWRLLYRTLSPISQTFARMALLGGLTGVRPKPAQTASEYGSSLASQFPEQRAAIEEITEAFVRERWSPQQPDPNEVGAHWSDLRATLVKRVPSGIAQRFGRFIRRGRIR